jgi:hypothetical protein
MAMGGVQIIQASEQGRYISWIEMNFTSESLICDVLIFYSLIFAVEFENPTMVTCVESQTHIWLVKKQQKQHEFEHGTNTRQALI